MEEKILTKEEKEKLIKDKLKNQKTTKDETNGKFKITD